MSYAIIRNEKMTRTEAKGSYVHNERRTRGHTNKDIDSENKVTFVWLTWCKGAIL